MAVNLVGQAGLERATAILESSFAQFQADRAVAGVARSAQRGRQELDELTVTCDRGDFAEYFRLRRELSEQEGEAARQRSANQRAAAVTSLGQLRRGDIIRVPGGRRAGVAVVLDPGAGAPGRRAGHAAAAAGADRRPPGAGGCRWPTSRCPVEPIDRVRIPNWFSARSPKHRRDLAASMMTKLAGRDKEPPSRSKAPPGRPRTRSRAAPPGPQPPLPRLPRPGRARPPRGAPGPAGTRGANGWRPRSPAGPTSSPARSSGSARCSRTSGTPTATG